MYKVNSIGLVKWYKPMIWRDKNPNHLLCCQNDIVMYFVERVSAWLIGLIAVLSPCFVLVDDQGRLITWPSVLGSGDGVGVEVYWTRPEAFRTGPQTCRVQGMKVQYYGAFTQMYHHWNYVCTRFVLWCVLMWFGRCKKVTIRITSIESEQAYTYLKLLYWHWCSRIIDQQPEK